MQDTEHPRGFDIDAEEQHDDDEHEETIQEIFLDLWAKGLPRILDAMARSEEQKQRELQDDAEKLAAVRARDEYNWGTFFQQALGMDGMGVKDAAARADEALAQLRARFPEEVVDLDDEAGGGTELS